MLEALIFTAAMTVSGAVNITRPGTLPAAAMKGDARHPAIVHIVSRNQTITIRSGQSGLLYSLTSTDGKVIVADATPDKFAELQPQLYRQLRNYIAASNDERPALLDASADLR